MKAKIFIKYKDGILDPQGTVTGKALKSIGIKNISSIGIGKFIEMEFNNLALKPDTEAKTVMDRLRKLLERKASGKVPTTPFNPKRL